MSSVERNREYYESPSAGRDDYWRYMAAPRARMRRIGRLVSTLAPSSIVDLGCGNGQLLLEIRAAWPQMRLTGIDLSAAQIEANRASLPAIEWVCANLQDENPPTARSFDLVIASEIIEHVDDPERLLRHAASLVHDGGHLILTTQSGRIGETERRVGHVRHFSAGEMRPMLAANGWQPVRVWSEGFPFHDLSKWWANRDPARSMERFGTRAYGRTQRAVCAALRFAFLFNSARRGAQLFALARKQP